MNIKVNKTIFDPGGFLVCSRKKFMFVVIAKNASTTLKKIVYSADNPQLPKIQNQEQIHDYFGYSLNLSNRISVKTGSKAIYDEFVKFVVYRDPVERFHSIYYDKVYSGRIKNEKDRWYFKKNNILDKSVDVFIEFVQAELDKPNALNQDEHIRRQSSFYTPDDVDHIVPIEYLNIFLNEVLGLDSVPRSNKSKANKIDVFTENQVQIIKQCYEKDYDLLRSTKVFRKQR